ncbi:hypothetical protein [Oceanobacillus chungangensis]|uniref:Uncharacterized protein n=1 Tax=Oceanobacillus chungangensis TaxID=1229152 RepID=A0A3D8PIR6_9BACI|nr:hypothetical protein [Oceanobacillus chungangensis]RDW15131.1 hypothetical protein CWR45_18365 [Oceanobacillus chungangensis]
MLHKAFNFGLSMTISGFVMIFFARIISDETLAGVATDIDGFFGIYDSSAYYIPFAFLIIGFPFVIIIPLIWFSRWSKK